MADAEEDFTFPATTANPPPCFFESPPLWRSVSPLENSEILKYEEVGDEGKFKLCSCQECKSSYNITLRKSFCYVDNDDEKEEKMDLLWEDLDEKLSRNCGKMAEESDNSSPGREVQICCVKTLKLSKANGPMINGLKAGILVLIRFLMKKGFAMHNSGSSIKKLAW